MNKKQLRHAFKIVINTLEEAMCENLRHPKRHQHMHDEICPIKYRLQRQAYLLREFMKEQGL